MQILEYIYLVLGFENNVKPRIKKVRSARFFNFKPKEKKKDLLASFDLRKKENE